MKPLQILLKDESKEFVNMLISLGDPQYAPIDTDVASKFTCRMYGVTETDDVDEARYSKLIEMTGKFDKVRAIFF